MVIGARNMQKTLLKAMLTPWDLLTKAQDEQNHTKVLALQEEIKTLPFGEVWDEYLRRQNVKGTEWFDDVVKYENEILLKRK